MGNCRADAEGDDTGKCLLLKADGAWVTVGDATYDGMPGVEGAAAAHIEWGGDTNATADGGDG